MGEKTVAAQQKMVAGYGFLEKAAEDAAALQAKWLEQSFKSVDEYNTLVRAGMKYWADLGADARKLAGEMMP